MLTLYAFSSDNWRRPARRGRRRCSLSSSTSPAGDAELPGARRPALGHRSAGPASPGAARRHRAAERATVGGRRLWLRIAHRLLRTGSDSLRRGTTERRARPAARDPGTIRRQLGEASGGHARRSPDVDLLIRTGGEQRLSDFLLWECAYAELFFIDKAWPDFNAEDFARILADYRRRDRRFGGLGTGSAGGAGCGGLTCWWWALASPDCGAGPKSLPFAQGALHDPLEWRHRALGDGPGRHDVHFDLRDVPGNPGDDLQESAPGAAGDQWRGGPGGRLRGRPGCVRGNERRPRASARGREVLLRAGLPSGLLGDRARDVDGSPGDQRNRVGGDHPNPLRRAHHLEPAPA